MKKLFWKAALHLLRQLSSTDINEQLIRKNEFLHAELQIIKAQLSASKKRLRFTILLSKSTNQSFFCP